MADIVITDHTTYIKITTNDYTGTPYLSWIIMKASISEVTCNNGQVDSDVDIKSTNGSIAVFDYPYVDSVAGDSDITTQVKLYNAILTML